MSRSAVAAAYRPDRTLGDYRIVRTIAHGGMATLLLARKSGPGDYGQSVVLKVMHPHLARRRELVELFANEARLGACVNHPNVCRVLDFDRLKDTYFIVLEYVRGETFGAVLDAIAKRPECHPLRIALSVRVLVQACEGLHAIHDASDTTGRALNIVHCDVAPDNLIVGYEGGVRVVDLGVARSEGGPGADGTLRGRPAYAAPEQLRGLAPDRRADVWSLGVILREALSGESPFAQPSVAATLRAVARGARKSWPAQVPPRLRAITDRALSLAASERFASARALGEALTRYLAVSGGANIDPAIVMHDLFAESVAQKERAARDSASDTCPDVAPSAAVASVSAVRMKRRESSLRSSRTRTARWLLLAASAVVFALTLCVHWNPTARVANMTRTPAPVRATARRAAQASTAASSLAASADATPVSDAPVVSRATLGSWQGVKAPKTLRAGRAPTFGTLVLGGSQGWAVVYEGERRLGTTPLRVKLSSGAHTLQVRPYGQGVARRVSVYIRGSETVRRVVAP